MELAGDSDAAFLGRRDFQAGPRTGDTELAQRAATSKAQSGQDYVPAFLPSIALYEQWRCGAVGQTIGKGEAMRRLVILILLLTVTLFSGPAKAQATPTFFYVVTAVDTNGFESAFSIQATATFPQGKSKANLAWAVPTIPAGGAAIAGYNVWRSSVSGGSYVKINTVLVTGVAYTDSFVLPNAPSGLVAPTS